MAKKVKPVQHKLPSTATTSFFDDVYEVVKKIPRGRVTSYGAIGACLGAKSSARMVGWAMGHALGHEKKIPAHRVVNRNGMLSGKAAFKTIDTMQKLLEKEGVKIKNDQVVDFKNKFWDPALNLEL